MARTAWLLRSGRADGGRRRRYQRWAGALAAVVAIGLPLLGATTAEASGPAGEFVSLTNSARSSHGVSRLAVSSDLSAIAHRQAQRMADKGELFHNPKLASEVQNWHKIGENVGYGPDALAIHNAFMHSAGHRANILDSAFRQIGVGVVVKNGVVWVSEVFRQPEGAVATPSPTKPKPKPKPSPTPSPTHRASHSSSPVHHVTPKPAASSTPSPTHHASRAPTASPHSSAPPVKHSTSPSHSSAAPRPSVTESASPTSTPSSSPTVPLPPKGPAAGAPLDTKPADSSSGASGLAALGTLGILAVLGLALSLRVRSH